MLGRHSPAVVAWLVFAALPHGAHADEETGPNKAVAAPFDLNGAKAALKAISYADCGSGGPGRVEVAFAADGTASGATVVEGSYSTSTTHCIEARFAKVRVAAFDDVPKRIALAIDLPPLATPSLDWRSAPGHHEEQRGDRRLVMVGVSLLVAGGGLLTLGAYETFFHACQEPSGDRCTRPRDGPPLLVAGTIVSAVGLIMINAGARHTVLVPNVAGHVVPVASAHGAGLSFVAAF